MQAQYEIPCSINSTFISVCKYTALHYYHYIDMSTRIYICNRISIWYVDACHYDDIHYYNINARNGYIFCSHRVINISKTVEIYTSISLNQGLWELLCIYFRMHAILWLSLSLLEHPSPIPFQLSSRYIYYLQQ